MAVTGRQYTELVGGPLDGSLCARRPDPFRYFQPAAQGVRSFTEPGANRFLYRLLKDGKYHYAHHQYRRCDQCGATISTPVCQICLTCE